MVQCIGCREAVTSSSRNLGTSVRLTYCACSIRWRSPKAREMAWLASMASSASVAAWSPMACTAAAIPAEAARWIQCSSSSGSITAIPWSCVPGHASDMWHVWEPRAPSAKSLSGPMEIHSSPEWVRIPRRMKSSICSCRRILCTRMSSSPRSWSLR